MQRTPVDDPAARAALTPSFAVDCEHPAVGAFAEKHAGSSSDPRARAVHLYYAVRDGFRYNPWGVQTDRQAFKASAILGRPREQGAHCVDKATVLAACCRRLGIPARLHFANVRNHIGTASLEKMLGTDLLVFHGYSELFLEGRWVAATPAFNQELCEKIGVAPLEFDGHRDSVFQEYDREGRRFMKYVHDYGTFTDIPHDLMIAEWRRHYPLIATQGWPRKPNKGARRE